MSTPQPQAERPQRSRLPWFTPRNIEPPIELPVALAVELVDEARAAEERLSASRREPRLGWAARELINHLADPSADLAPREITQALGSAMCETLQTTSAGRTGLGCVIVAAVGSLMSRRQVSQPVRPEVDDGVRRAAVRSAANIERELPSVRKAVEHVIEHSSEVLRAHARRETGADHVRMFRGVRGDEVPADLDAASGTRYLMRTLASWSTDHDETVRFANHPVGAILEALVPVECLVLAPGYGEAEILVTPLRLGVSETTTLLHELTVTGVHPPEDWD